MAVKKLIQPKHLNIDIKPSPRQYELWKCLQPECPDCGGEVKNTFIGIDEHGNRKFVPECSGCGSRNIPQMILGGGAAGGGKFIDYQSLICTPNGFKPLKDIKVGDFISNPITGGEQKVIYLHPIEEHHCYKLDFLDGTSSICSEGHLWSVRSPSFKPIDHEIDILKQDRVWEAKRIYNWFSDKKQGKHKKRSLSIPLPAPITFDISMGLDLCTDIDPYILGALIGDGSFNKSAMSHGRVDFTSMDQGIVDEFIRSGYDMGTFCQKEKDKSKTYRIYNRSLINSISYLGLKHTLSDKKFIPNKYKYASIEHRIHLLQGLLDTDGGVDIRGHVSYTTTSKQLSEDIAFIIRSLGGIATIKEHTSFYRNKAGERVNAKNRFIIYINTSFNKDLFRLKRKQDRCINLNQKRCCLRKHISSVDYIGKRKSRCITVSDPTGLYLTDDFTVTHNSYIGSTWLCSSCIRFPNLRMGLVRKQLKDIKNSTLVTIKKVLTGWGLIEDVNYSINNLTNIISFWNGSEILMMELADLPSDADFSRIGSLELSGVMVEEGSEISERAADTIFSRIRWQLDKSFKVPKMFIGTNPAPCWLRNRFVQDDEGNPVECRDNERFIRFSVWDNPDDEFRRTYEASLNRIKDNATRERLLYGNWDFSEPNSMAIYNKFNGDRHLESDVKGKYYNPLKPVIVSVDFNVAPHMSSIVSQIDYENKRVYIFSEVLGLPKDKENNTPAFAKKLKKYLIDWKHMGGVNITGDPSGKQRSTTSEDGVNNYTIISDALGENALRPTIKLFRKQPPQKTRCEFVNDLFDFYDGWSIIIDKNCRRLIEDLIFQPKNEDGTKSKKKVTDPKTQTKYEKYGHLSDCLDYLLCFFLKESYNTFISGNEDIDKIASVPAAYTGFNY